MKKNHAALPIRRTARIAFEIDAMRAKSRFLSVTTGILLALLALGNCLSSWGQSVGNVTLAWDPSPSTGVIGYNIHQGRASQVYTNILRLGNVTSGTMSNLVPGVVYYFAATAKGSSGVESDFSNEISYRVPSLSVPAISAIAAQSVNQGGATAQIPFTVSDAQAAASNLIVSAASSNLLLVPSTSIVLGGAGTNRTIKITPAPAKSGTATISLTVNNGTSTASTSFVLTVIPPPVVVLGPPIAGSSYTAPGTLGLSATVVANTHTIAGVRFYNGSTLLGQVVGSPFMLTWSQVAAGSYSLTAQAVYDAGSVVSSLPVLVSVSNPPPVVFLQAPVSGANFTAPGGVTLSAGVVPNGHTLNGVKFYSGSTLVAQQATPPYTAAWNNISPGTYNLSAQLTYDSVGLVSTPVSTIAVTNLSAPWQTLDVGGASIPGTAAMLGTDSWALNGTGNIGGTNDQFRFLHQPMTGDGYAIVQLTSAQGAATNSCFGIMIRESLAAGSAYVMVGALPDGTFRCQARSSAGANTTAAQSGFGVMPDMGFYLRRVGNTFYRYKWDGGANWIFISSISIPMASNTYVGMVVSSGGSNSLSSARFDYVSIQP